MGVSNGMKLNPLTGYLLIAIAAVLLLLFTLHDKSVRAPGPDQITVPVLNADDPVKGEDLHAPVVLVGFGSYTCTACEKLSKVLEATAERFGNNVLVSWRDVIPPGADTAARDAAIAARCAAEQGQYWPAHDTLFASAGYVPTILRTLPTDLGLDEAAYEACRTSGSTQFAAMERTAEARALGLTRLPAFFVNNTPYYGVPDEASFLRWIEQLLP